MTERALSATEYLALAEQAPIMIWRSGTDAKCDYFNRRWLDFTGRTIEQEMGDGWAEGVHADDLERCLKTYMDAFERRDIFEIEYRLRRNDGQYRWVFDRGVPIVEDGTFGGFIGSCVDVTERVEAQRQLARAYDAALDTLRGFLPLCAWCKKIKDDDGNWTELESFVGKHADVKFSHGMCPACHAKGLGTRES
jgi:PAS domain S-box-containing protein